MMNFNRLAIVAILAVALVAICSVANAAPVSSTATVTVDKVHINGHYVGVPTLLGNVPGYYGYTYTLVPDGTYTVFGHIKNDDPNNTTSAWVGAGTKAHEEVSQWFSIPKGGKVSFQFTCAAASKDDFTVGYDNPGFHFYDLSGVDFVDTPDSTTHTVNQGPMSDAVAIYANGKLTYNGQPQFWAYI